MPTELQEKLTKIGELSDDQLKELENELLNLLEDLAKDPSDENLAAMDEAAEGVNSIRGLLLSREEDRASRQNKVTDILAKIKATEPATTESKNGSSEPTTNVDTQDSVAHDSDAMPAKSEDSSEPTPEPVLARGDRPTVAELARARPASMAPHPEPNPHLTILAAADVPGISAGSAFQTWQDVGRAFADKVHALMGSSNLGRRYPVARLKVSYPEDRLLTAHDPILNSRKIDEVLSPRALVASGGLCAPVDVHYGLTNVSQASRPLRDSLARFGAERGGIRFITPPKLSDVEDAVGITTATDDAGGATKPRATVICGQEVSVQVKAISVRLKVGNFSRHTFPEQFQTWFDLALAQHARRAEGAILDSVSASSTAVTDGQNLGAARDLLEAHDRLATQYRNRHRMDPNATLVVWLPHWVVAMFRADVLRQAPGDGFEQFAVTQEMVESWYRARNLAVTFYQDTRTGAGQVYGNQAAGGGLPWITTVEAYLFHPQAFLFLDGGELNFGVDIRDSTLNSTNDVEAFLETFENVAFLGVESLRVRSTVCVSGQASALATFTCPGTGS